MIPATLAQGLRPVRTELANGVVILGQESGTVPAVTINATFFAGSAQDPVDLPGVAYLTRRVIDRGDRIHVANDGEAQRRRLEALAVELEQVSAADRLKAGDGSLEGASIRVGQPIERPDQRIYAADRRVVIVLPDRSDGLDATLVEFKLGEERRSDDIGDQCQEVVEVFGQAVAGNGKCVPRGRHT